MGRNRRLSLPQVRLHSGSGHARVRINGTEHWLGRFGSPEAQAAYDRFLAEYLANGRQVAPRPKVERQETPPPIPQPEAVPASLPPDIATVSTEVTIAEVCVLFMEHAKTYYKLSDGRLSSSYDGMLQAVNALRPFGKPPASAFGPRCLGQVMERLVDGPTKSGKPWPRKSVNRGAAGRWRSGCGTGEAGPQTRQHHSGLRRSLPREGGRVGAQAGVTFNAAARL